MRKREIVVSFDLDRLQSYTDEYLAQLHHVCQANPAEFGDKEACETAEAVKSEIVRRWLARVPAELYHHQAKHILMLAGAERLDAKKRREMALAIVGDAPDNSAKEMESAGWHRCTVLLDREPAISEVMDRLGDVDEVVTATRACAGWFVWTKPKG